MVQRIRRQLDLRFLERGWQMRHRVPVVAFCMLNMLICVPMVQGDTGIDVTVSSSYNYVTNNGDVYRMFPRLPER